jgi:ribosomal protein S27E
MDADKHLPPPTESTPGEVLMQEDFAKMFCQDCGKKPEEHTLTLTNKCHRSSAVKVTYSGGRLYVDCWKCGEGIAVVQVAKKG